MNQEAYSQKWSFPKNVLFRQIKPIPGMEHHGNWNRHLQYNSSWIHVIFSKYLKCIEQPVQQTRQFCKLSTVSYMVENWIITHVYPLEWMNTQLINSMIHLSSETWN
jgi:hypothetical protein